MGQIKCKKCIWKDLCGMEIDCCDYFYNEKSELWEMENFYNDVIAENCDVEEEESYE